MNDFISECIRLQSKGRLQFATLLKHKYSQAFLNIIHLTNSSNAQQVLYHAISGDYLPPKCLRNGCENNCLWWVDYRKYRTSCSGSCAVTMSSLVVKANNLTRIGVQHHSQLPDHMDKVKATNNRLYGTDFYTQTDEWLNRIKITNNEKYGNDYCTQVPEFKEKSKETSLERYGAEHWKSTDTGQEKFEAGMIRNHNVKSPGHSKEIRNKIKQTCNEKYGCDSPLQVQDFIDQRVKTRRKKHYGEKLMNLLDDPEWVNKIFQEQLNGKTVAQIADEVGILSNNLGKIFNKHGLEPVQHGTRYLESKLRDYFINKGINVDFRNKKIIKPKEIDLVFPDIKFGVECDGAYYHSEEFEKDQNYHLNKTINSAKAGYELWHFWDWEIADKWTCVTDKINSKLGLNKSIGARKLKIKIIDGHVKTDFVNSYHIQNDCKSSINIGLVDNNDQLLMIATFGKSRFNKNYKFELLRMCSKHGISIAGGASKLLKYFSNSYMQPDETLISYCNLRFSTGNVYEKIGFTKLRENLPGYCYTRRGLYSGSRNQWTKKDCAKKLDIFETKLSEVDNMKMNGYYRLWDCGQAVYIYTKS